ncbi:hypothetical protein K7432_017135 [Basidiobolus ranarum]|uniref:Uncharacterized protein n=1 Tax=Basidiobolus ranarum TaxID=34480 RepID=A0ABR2VKQ9_9FUNG
MTILDHLSDYSHDSADSNHHNAQNSSSLRQTFENITGKTTNSNTEDNTDGNQHSKAPLVVGAGILAAAVGVGATVLGHKSSRNDDEYATTHTSKDNTSSLDNDDHYRQTGGAQNDDQYTRSDGYNRNTDVDIRDGSDEYSTTGIRAGNYPDDSYTRNESTSSTNPIRQKFNELTGKDSNNGNEQDYDSNQQRSKIPLAAGAGAGGVAIGSGIAALGNRSGRNEDNTGYQQYDTSSYASGQYTSNDNNQERYNQSTGVTNDNDYTRGTGYNRSDENSNYRDESHSRTNPIRQKFDELTGRDSDYGSNEGRIGNQHRSNAPLGAGAGGAAIGAGVATALGHRSAHDETSDYVNRISSDPQGTHTTTTDGSALGSGVPQSQGNYGISNLNTKSSEFAGSSDLQGTNYASTMAGGRGDTFGSSLDTASYDHIGSSSENRIHSQTDQGNSNYQQYSQLPVGDSDFTSNPNNEEYDRNTSLNESKSDHSTSHKGVAGAGVAAAAALAAGAAMVSNRTDKNRNNNTFSDENNIKDSSRRFVDTSEDRIDSEGTNPLGENAIGHSEKRTSTQEGNNSPGTEAYDSTQPHIGGTSHPTLGKGSVGNVANNDPSAYLVQGYNYESSTPGSSAKQDFDASYQTPGKGTKQSAAIIGGSALGSGLAGSALTSHDSTVQSISDSSGNRNTPGHSNSAIGEKKQHSPYGADLYPSGNILNPNSYQNNPKGLYSVQGLLA